MKKLLLIFFYAISLCCFAAYAAKRPVVILSAMQLEQAPLLKRAKNIRHHKYFGLPYVTASLDGAPVVLAVTGIGKFMQLWRLHF